jgi:hypothetical protein
VNKASESNTLNTAARVLFPVLLLIEVPIVAAFVGGIPVLVALVVLLVLRLPLRFLLWGHVMFWYCVALAVCALATGLSFWPGTDRRNKSNALIFVIFFLPLTAVFLIVAFILPPPPSH